MADKKTIDFGLDGIGHQLADRLLAVPVYQRSYSWEDDQINDFCSDLKAAFSGDTREYFLGTLVLSKEGAEGRVTIIDGQQRMATTSMLIASIRDWFRNNAESQRADAVHSKYLGDHDMREDAFVPRLCLNREDNEFYRRLVVEGDRSAEPTRPSHVLIKRAMELLDEFVSEIAAMRTGDLEAEQLVEWLEFIKEELRVIYVLVPTESDAFMIFETLNDRGADLTLADLLKNYLFGLSGSELEAVRDRWILSLGALDQSTDVFITFLRHHWSSHHGLVRERDLYKSIKEGVATKSQAIRFAEDLEQSSLRYAALLNGRHEYWGDYSAETQSNIETINRLGIEQSRPLLIAVLQHFATAEQERVLQAAVSWSVRGLIVGGIGGGTTEKAYCNAALKVRGGVIKSADDLLAELDAIIPSDTAFREAFAQAKVTKASLARYYLLALEQKTREEANPELVPNSNEEEVNLEHVLPKRARVTDWPEFSDEERRSLVDRIGNMALLRKDHNNAIGSKSFEIKKAILAQSVLELTKEIGETSSWTAEAIKARQDRLALLAVSTWQREP